MSFYTDSDFAINVLTHIEAGTIHDSPHKRDLWDIIERLCVAWNAQRFHAFKIKSHLKLEDARSQEEAFHIRNHYRSQRTMLTKIYQYVYSRPVLRTNDNIGGKFTHPMQHLNIQPLLSVRKIPATQIAVLRDGSVSGDQFELLPEPHRVVFWSCLWGCNYARLVWSYCNPLKWPNSQDPGISWTELTVSLCCGWAGFYLSEFPTRKVLDLWNIMI